VLLLPPAPEVELLLLLLLLLLPPAPEVELLLVELLPELLLELPGSSSPPQPPGDAINTMAPAAIKQVQVFIEGSLLISSARPVGRFAAGSRISQHLGKCKMICLSIALKPCPRSEQF